jgi:hypothetical protein
VSFASYATCGTHQLTTTNSGVALYCWSGLNATATFFVSSAAKETGFGSLQAIAFCYALGIMMAVIFCGPTSGAHLSPGVTISFAIFKGFPWRKVPREFLSFFSYGATDQRDSLTPPPRVHFRSACWWLRWLYLRLPAV